MLSRMLLKPRMANMAKRRLARASPIVAARPFGHGPYNPLHYKAVLAPEEMPTTEDYYEIVKSMHSEPPAPLYNMRHIHPVR